jgi:hypothetical protein
LLAWAKDERPAGIKPPADLSCRRRRRHGVDKEEIVRKLFWLVCLTAVAAFPAAARADGIAFAGVKYGGAGVAAPDKRVRYVTLPLSQKTMVMRIDGRGSVIGVRQVPGSWGIPMVAFDGSTGGLSADGRTLVLAQPPIGRMRAVSRFPVLRTRTLRPVETVTLRGSFSFDALSPDGSTLYVIEHVNRRDVAEYQVRAYDIERSRLLPYPIRDHRSDQVEMYGYPVSRAASPDGRWAYTLYQGSHHSFVHALDTVARTAVCVDLPVDTPPEQVSDAHLVVGPGGETLAIDSRTGGTIGVIDTKTLSLETAPAEEPTVPAAQVRTPAPAGEREADRRSLPWALLAGAIALAAGAFGARRLRRRRSSALDELGLVLAPLERSPGDELDGRLDDEHRAQALADRAGEPFRPSGVTRELDGHGERRLLLHAGRGGPYADVAADRWGESGDDLADRAREDVHPADDQHVVGAADAADPRAGAATRTRARLHDHVVAGAEAQERRGALA